jgi:hypothetical protein
MLALTRLKLCSRNGARAYLEEVVRSTLHPGSAEAAQRLLDSPESG